ncbi:MAG TPA: DUF2254 domain-containing protein [Acidimicrobiales bacterium]|nr:DUF2254 domain-containing protein [Acidimicrobiales bacterium]
MNLPGALARLRKSLLPVPMLFSVVAIVLAVITSALDRSFRFETGLFPGGAESARSLLSAIASASLTLTAVVFSITMLVLQLTSAQYSPRVLYRFLGDRVSQIALGVFASTFSFSLAALRGVAPDSVPVTSVAIAFLLALVTIAVFVVYVNHIAQQIQVSSIIWSIEKEAAKACDRVYSRGNDHGDQDGWPGTDAVLELPTPRRGVVTAANVAGVVDAARKLDVAVELVPLVGEWVPDGAPLLRIYGTDDVEDPHTLTRHVSLADERDMSQDPAYGLRQLVDIAERALSPGTNDPTTAVQAVNALHNLLVRVAGEEDPPGITCDETGQPRLRRHHRSFSDLLDLSVDETLLYGRHSLQVTAGLEKMVADLLRVVHGRRAELVAAKLERVRAERQKLLTGDASFAGAASRRSR